MVTNCSDMVVLKTKNTPLTPQKGGGRKASGIQHINLNQEILIKYTWIVNIPIYKRFF